MGRENVGLLIPSRPGASGGDLRREACGFRILVRCKSSRPAAPGRATPARSHRGLLLQYLKQPSGVQRCIT
jgi:hypothetical protein